MHTIRPAFRKFCRAFFTAAWFFTAAVAVQAGQLDAATFFLIDTGMQDSEVLVRAGPPDLLTSPGGETFQVIDGSRVVNHHGVTRFDTVRNAYPGAIRQWHYVPDSSEHDPHLTVITMKNGRVFDMERTKIFSREGLPEPKVAPYSRRKMLTDEEIVRRRLERTLNAAEQYARIRSRLKHEEIELTRAAAGLPEMTAADTDDRVYRSVDDDGVVYYGDRPVARSPIVIDR